MIHPKPLVYFKPKPLRLPRRKIVTIVMGFKAQAGIVLGADSQETISDISKTNCCKTLNVADRMVLTGSGDSDYLDAVFYEIATDFTINNRATPEEVQTDIQQILIKFYKLHVLPFMRFESDLGINLLIAAHIGGQNYLWKTSRNSISPVSEYASAGAGEYMARILFDRFYPGMHSISITTAKYLLAYLLYYVKKFVPGCGGTSSIYCFHADGHIEGMGRDVDAAEKLFEELDTLLGLQMLFVTGAGEHREAVAKVLDRLREQLLGLHDDLRKLS